jgi:hypothetical protein
MTHVTLNGKDLGTIAASNLDNFVRETRFTIVSRTATAIVLEG